MNIKRVKNILLMAAFAIVAASCQKNGPQDGELYGDSIVRFAPSIVNTTEAIDTKGTLINEDGPFDTFFVRAWDNDTFANIIPGGEGYQKVKMKGSQWNTVYTKEGKEYAKEYIWKKDETKVFYAYANIPDSGVEFANTSAGAQSMTYTVPASASEQKDILMGYYSGDGTTGTTPKMTGTASIVFSHPLTAVQFVYGDISGDVGIKSISLAKVAGTGTATMDDDGDISWTSVVTPLDYTVSQTNDSGLSVDGTTKLIGEPFIIIPQDVETYNVIVNVTFKNDVTASATISSGKWETGKNYIYKLNYVVHPMASELSVTLVDWTNLLSKDGDEIFDVTFGTKSTE